MKGAKNRARALRIIITVWCRAGRVTGAIMLQYRLHTCRPHSDTADIHCLTPRSIGIHTHTLPLPPPARPPRQLTNAPGFNIQF